VIPNKLTRLRRALALRGLTPASFVPEASAGRAEDVAIRPARLVEGGRLESFPVGAAERWPDSLAFLDGVQRTELLAYDGHSPIVVATIAAAVRERTERRLHTVLEERRFLVLARPDALAVAGDALEGFDPVALPDEDDGHPSIDLILAARAVDRERGALEIGLGLRYRARSRGWLIVDGGLTESPDLSRDPFMVGVVKSHASLPFEGADLDRYLRLPHAHRSSIFVPATRSLTPVYSWALRLWAWEGRDLFHGLVRVETAPGCTGAQADQLSRWLLSERAPLSAPDGRWDRLLYGVHSVEAYLRAATPTSV
jgi:hypothetical protein